MTRWWDRFLIAVSPILSILALIRDQHRNPDP